MWGRIIGVTKKDARGLGYKPHEVSGSTSKHSPPRFHTILSLNPFSNQPGAARQLLNLKQLFDGANGQDVWV